MAVDIRLGVSNTPGKIARIARALADEGVNIEGIGCDIRPGETWGFVHFLVENLEKARHSLEAAGCEILDVHDVDLVETKDEPGALAAICESYLERGENIEVLYIGTRDRLVVGTESMRRAWTGRTTANTTYADTTGP